jgi:hypothetical protein
MLQRAITIDATDSLPRMTLGRAYVQKGDFAAAIPLIEKDLGQLQRESRSEAFARRSGRSPPEVAPWAAKSVFAAYARASCMCRLPS